MKYLISHHRKDTRPQSYLKLVLKYQFDNDFMNGNVYKCLGCWKNNTTYENYSGKNIISLTIRNYRGNCVIFWALLTLSLKTSITSDRI